MTEQRCVSEHTLTPNQMREALARGWAEYVGLAYGGPPTRVEEIKYSRKTDTFRVLTITREKKK